MQPPHTRLRGLRDAAVAAVLLAVLLVTGRLTATSFHSGHPATPDRTPPPAPAAQTPPPRAPPRALPRALPRTLPVAARIPLPGSAWSRQAEWGEHNAVAAGSGAVWIAHGCGVVRIDPRTNRVTAAAAIRERDPHGNPCRVHGLSIGDDGGVWVATNTALLRIDRAGGRIRLVATTLAVAPSGAPAAAAAAIWVPCCQVAESEHASLPLQGWLLRVDPATEQVVARIPLSGGHPMAVGAGQGAVWVAGYRDRQARLGGVIEHAPVLWRVDPATNRAAGAVAPPGGPTVIGGSEATPPSVLADQDVVFMSDPSTGVVWQVDARRHRFVGRVTVVQGGPLAVAAGVAWAAGASGLTPLTGANAGGDGLRLPDPPRLTDPLGRWITGLAAGADALWLATWDALYRIDLRALRRGCTDALRMPDQHRC